MNTKSLFFFFIIFFSISAFGIDYNIDKTIQWNDTLQDKPTFRDAIYFKKYGNTPFISGVLELPYSPNAVFTVNKLQKSILNSNISTNVITFLKTNNVQFDFVVEKAGTKYLLKYWFPAILFDDGVGFSKINSISFTISITPKSVLKSLSGPISTNENSKLASGKWYKFEVIKNGIYKLSKKELSNLGINVTKSIRIFTFPKDVNIGFNKSQIYDDLYECPVYYSDGGDGVFNGNDYLLFYGESADSWKYDSKNKFYDHFSNSYSISNYYYVLVDDGEPLKIETLSSNASPDITTSSYKNYDYYENNESNISKSGQEWFETIPIETMKFSLLDKDDNTISFKVRMISDESSIHDLTINKNGTFLQTISMSGGGNESNWISNINYFSSTISESTFKLSIADAFISSGSKSMLDYFIINYKSKLTHGSKQLLFSGINSFKQYKNPQYSISSTGNIQVWNVNNSLNPKKVQLIDNTTTKSFVYPSDTIEKFVAFADNESYIPTFKGVVKNQDLHANKNVNMIIVTADDFISQANQLKDLHYKSDGIESIVVTQNQVFNEFSGGRICPEAIRDYARYIYEKGNNNLKFLLFIGDGSYVNKNLNTNNSIITYETIGSITEGGSIVTEDFFGLLDVGEGINESDDFKGALDIAIGRIPVSNVEEANNAIKKISNYCSGSKTRGDWRNRMVFLADDADGNQIEHMQQANELADKCVSINSNLITDKVFLDAYPQESIAGGQRYPSVNKTVESKIKNGCLIFNYTGHGNALRMAEEIVVDKTEVDKWQNTNALPLFIAAACQVSRFDDPERNSLGEDIFLSNHGGGIAIIAATRSVYSGPNKELNSNLFDYMFNLTIEGKPQFIGNVLMYAKNKYVSDDFNKYNFVLLGDPAIRLALPIYNVITDKVNGLSVNSVIDTLKALSKVTITGHVEDLNSALVSTYNGNIHAVVFDKPQLLTTLSNDGGTAINFSAQNNILFKGKASVQNGVFSFTFIVPKDIYYYYGNGRISYYVDNGNTDGAGSFKQFIVGGSSNNTIEKNGGPVLNLYMNDTNFVYGGITNNSPTLLIKAEDDYGINISGTAVGHDATAVFDGNKSQQVILNQFYEANQNTYQKGAFRYPVSELTEGKHTVNVNVWNINNELSKEYLEFYVEGSANLALLHVLNYPNPFTTNTNFFFEHNQSNQIFEVLIQIYTITGKLVKTISTSYYSEGNRSMPISWDGNDDYGDKIGRGVYIYKVKVKNEQQQIAQKIEKLVILK